MDQSAEGDVLQALYRKETMRIPSPMTQSVCPFVPLKRGMGPEQEPQLPESMRRDGEISPSHTDLQYHELYWLSAEVPESC